MVARKRRSKERKCKRFEKRVVFQTYIQKKGMVESMNRLKRECLEQIAGRGKLAMHLEKYIRECKKVEDGKKGGRLPNLAGFCRWLGCGIGEVETLRLTHPAESDYLAAVMEDEALNTPAVSPTVVAAYLKRRLGYAEKADSTAVQTDCGEVRLIFGHDILEDGA